MEQVRTFHRYRLLRRIARGGMAEVYLASYQGYGGFERRVALKKILPVYAGMAEFAGLFRDEGRVSGILDHSGIVQVLDFGVHEEQYFIAMEYVDGPDLEEVLDRCRRRGILPPIEVVLHIGARLAGCLEYAHGLTHEGEPLNLVHRDVSPPNVLIGLGGEVKLTDFGVARHAIRTDKTRPGVLRGKYAYMSPEQIKHGRVDQRSDLFSLGTLLYETLTCVNPFEAINDYQTMEAVGEARFEPAGFLRPDTPAALDRILLQCLDEDPANRFPDAGALRRELASVMLQWSRADEPQVLVDFLRDVFPERAASDADMSTAEGLVPLWEHLAHHVDASMVPVPTSLVTTATMADSPDVSEDGEVVEPRPHMRFIASHPGAKLASPFLSTADMPENPLLQVFARASDAGRSHPSEPVRRERRSDPEGGPAVVAVRTAELAAPVSSAGPSSAPVSSAGPVSRAAPAAPPAPRPVASDVPRARVKLKPVPAHRQPRKPLRPARPPVAAELPEAQGVRPPEDLVSTLLEDEPVTPRERGDLGPPMPAEDPPVERAIFREVGPKARRKNKRPRPSSFTNPFSISLPPDPEEMLRDDAHSRPSFVPAIGELLGRRSVGEVPVLGIDDSMPPIVPDPELTPPLGSLLRSTEPLIQTLNTRPPETPDGLPFVNEWELDHGDFRRSTPGTGQSAPPPPRPPAHDPLGETEVPALAPASPSGAPTRPGPSADPLGPGSPGDPLGSAPPAAGAILRAARPPSASPVGRGATRPAAVGRGSTRPASLAPPSVQPAQLGRGGTSPGAAPPVGRGSTAPGAVTPARAATPPRVATPVRAVPSPRASTPPPPTDPSIDDSEATVPLPDLTASLDDSEPPTPHTHEDPPARHRRLTGPLDDSLSWSYAGLDDSPARGEAFSSPGTAAAGPDMEAFGSSFKPHELELFGGLEGIAEIRGGTLASAEAYDPTLPPGLPVIGLVEEREEMPIAEDTMAIDDGTDDSREQLPPVTDWIRRNLVLVAFALVGVPLSVAVGVYLARPTPTVDPVLEVEETPPPRIEPLEPVGARPGAQPAPRRAP